MQIHSFSSPAAALNKMQWLAQLPTRVVMNEPVDRYTPGEASFGARVSRVQCDDPAATRIYFPSATSCCGSGSPADGTEWHQNLSSIDNQCYYCKGTGECQHDERPGTGKNWRGEDEYFCSGSGECQKCDGTGILD